MLKQAGVVDSGGQGLMQVVKGIFKGPYGPGRRLYPGPEAGSFLTQAGRPPSGSRGAPGIGAASQDIETADIRFGYCTEFIINLEREYGDKDEQELQGLSGLHRRFPGGCVRR